jgi:rhamnosyltransferase
MDKENIYAIIICYQGGREILDTYRAVVDQVNKVVIVDNGSGVETFKVLASIRDQEKCRLIYLNDNYGIARAQNAGVSLARAEGAVWVLTLDQDSICYPDMVQRLLDVARKHPKGTLGFCCPTINYGATEAAFPVTSAVSEVTYAISSGCLFPMATLISAGEQCNEYFIDSVDFEYCLRLTSTGYKLLRVDNARLDHCLGKREKVGFFRTTFWISTHEPIRRYYIFRNHIFLIRKYWRIAPLFLAKKTFFLLLMIGQIVVLEHDKIQNIRQCSRGLLHGLLNLSGKSSGRF